MLEPPQAGEQMRARPRPRQSLAPKERRATSLDADGCGRTPYVSPPSLDPPVQELAPSFDVTGTWEGMARIPVLDDRCWVAVLGQSDRRLGSRREEPFSEWRCQPPLDRVPHTRTSGNRRTGVHRKLTLLAR